MKKHPGKLILNRESLRRLENAELRELGGGMPPPTAECPYTVQPTLCYSARVPSCVCTGTGP